jgi:predicted transcriptional regulator
MSFEDTSELWRERVRRIAREECSKHHVAFEEILDTRTRFPHVVAARAAVIRHTEQETKYSLAALAEALGFDRKTVSSALKGKTT